MAEEKRNDEITIDLGSIFKKKKGNKEKSPKEKIEITEVKDLDEPKENIKIHESKESSEKKEKSDEVSIDLTKVKNFFSKDKHQETSDDDTINIGSIAKSLDKKKNILIPLVIILICMFFSVYFRSFPAYLPITDDWATNSVHNYYKSQITQQVNQQNPFLPAANKNQLVEDEFKRVLEENKDQIQASIKETSSYFKSTMQDDAGQTYLVAIDPYFWYRNARNYLDHGFSADIEINGEYYDTHRMAPFIEEEVVKRDVVKDFGLWLGKKFGNLNVLIEVWLYRILSLFNSNISLMAAAFYVPVIIGSLAVIPAFFIARRISGNVGGFFAAFMVAIHPFVLTRTAGGFADTDPYNILFPLLITWVFLEAFESQNLKKKISLTILSGLFVGLYSFAWSGWSFIFNILLAASGIFLIYQMVINREMIKKGILNLMNYFKIKNTIIIIITFIISSGISVTSFSGMRAFLRGLTEYIKFAQMKDVAVTSLWYNVYTTVAELNPLSWKEIVNQIGGQFLFSIALIGVLLTIIKRNDDGSINLLYAALVSVFSFLAIYISYANNSFVLFVTAVIAITFFVLFTNRNIEKETDIKAALVIILWFFATAYASTRGVRFILIMAPAFALGFGIALGLIYDFFSKFLSKEMHVEKAVSGIVVFILLSTLLISPVRSANTTAKNEIPSMNDAWYESLIMIKENSSEDAIINSWWDFGHWFKAIADRGVTLDGGGQNQPQAHWLGKLMLTSDEKMSVGILRMLDCGKTYSFDLIDEKFNDTLKTINTLYEIIPVERDEAETILLSKGFNEDETEKILDYTHCENPPENYFITSADMVNKAGVWGHFGSWDFERAAMYQRIKKIREGPKAVDILMNEFNLSEEKADQYFYEIHNQDADQWVSGWPGYASNLKGCTKINNDSIQCSQNLGGQTIPFNINLTTMDAVIPASPVDLHPVSVVYPTEEGIDEKRYKDNTIPYSIAIIKSGDSYQSIMMAPELATSMFTTLFFYDGIGLEHYEKFHDVTDVTGARIIVWKINWEGKVGTDE
ncbi:MAG: STT3 domain-containing protein [Candidatus Nanoarchaeia archaeon]|nr:STT3 domain-containing protein [Candidatus Nanoarchaeia archaeon]